MPLWEALRGHRVIIELPSAELDDLVATGEVLLQEGLPVWVLPAGEIDRIEDLCGVFGRRAILGVRDVRLPGQVAAAQAAGAAFALSPFGFADLVGGEGVPVALGGLTPHEIAGAARLTGAVQVIPCDALGSMYARSLPALFPGVPLIATGRMERYLMALWLEAGVAAICPQGWLPAEEVSDHDLSRVRRRCRELIFDQA